MKSYFERMQNDGQDGGETKHTKGRYFLDQYGHIYRWQENQGGAEAVVIIAAGHSAANAEEKSFIVEACNNHARLTAINNDLADALEQCITSDGAACWKSKEYMERRINYITELARAALARAGR
jgi:hypothetical protein